VSSLVAGDRIAFRCDGNERIGAGHVARCLPLAKAFAELGWTVDFVGAYRGLAAWLLARADIHTRAACLELPCGISPEHYDAVVLDSYSIAPVSICELGHMLPLATIAEANRCPTRGVLLDYHLDRIERPGGDPLTESSFVERPGSEPLTESSFVERPGGDLLAGPSFAPLDPAIAGAGRPGEQIRKVLVTVGGSAVARPLLTPIARIVSSTFPRADIVIAGTEESETKNTNPPRVSYLPWPSALADVLGDIDLAITAAGLTAYELACAGIPQVAIAIAANQRRVAKGLNKSDLALTLDLTSGDSLALLPGALERLRDAGLRRQLSERGRAMFDGQGARRAASALTELYRDCGKESLYTRKRSDS
jgi:UDP-2,4-diacetamido-2,4,6-trideoxy-beta-L-altropyranose hydrolase